MGEKVKSGREGLRVRKAGGGGIGNGKAERLRVGKYGGLGEGRVDKGGRLMVGKGGGLTVGKVKGSVRGRIKIEESEMEGRRVGEGLSLNPPPFSHACIINLHSPTLTLTFSLNPSP